MKRNKVTKRIKHLATNTLLGRGTEPDEITNPAFRNKVTKSQLAKVYGAGVIKRNFTKSAILKELEDYKRNRCRGRKATMIYVDDMEPLTLQDERIIAAVMRDMKWLCT